MAGMRAPGGKMSDMMPGAQQQTQVAQVEFKPRAKEPKDLGASLKAILDSMSYSEMCEAESYFETAMIRAESAAIMSALIAMGGKAVVTFNDMQYRLNDKGEVVQNG